MNKPIARLYLRVGSASQDLTRQDALKVEAETKGYNVVATYAEKESGATENRPALQRMLADLGDGDVVIAERLDSITRLPLKEAEALMKKITDKGATVSVPGLIDLPKVGDGPAAIVMDTMQAMLLKLALYLCRTDWETGQERQRQGIEVAKAKGVYKGRKPDTVANAKMVELRALGYTIAKVAYTLSVSESQAMLILKKQAA